MKKLNNYILEKFKLNKNGAINLIKYCVNDDFIIDPDKTYYTIKTLGTIDSLKDSHIIYRDNSRSIYLYEKEELRKACKEYNLELIVRLFENKYKDKIRDILAGKIDFNKYCDSEPIKTKDLFK